MFNKNKKITSIFKHFERHLLFFIIVWICSVLAGWSLISLKRLKCVVLNSGQVKMTRCTITWSKWEFTARAYFNFISLQHSTKALTFEALLNNFFSKSTFKFLRMFVRYTLWRIYVLVHFLLLDYVILQPAQTAKYHQHFNAPVIMIILYK